MKVQILTTTFESHLFWIWSF